MFSMMCCVCHRLLGNDGSPVKFRGGMIDTWDYLSKIAFRTTKKEILALAREKGWKTERSEFLCAACVKRRLLVLKKPPAQEVHEPLANESLS